MIKQNFRFILSALSLFSILFLSTSAISAAPVRFKQVTQVVNAKPGKANSGNYTNLQLNNDPVNDPVNDPKKDGDKDGDKKETKAPTQDRVITETSFEIITEEDCNCTQPKIGGGFPYWALLGLGAIPFLFLIPDNDPDPTPTQTVPTTPTPTTPTPTTPTPTTPTPPTEPVPEPMTILLFGIGLAGIGVAARKRFGKRGEEDEGEE